MRLAALGDREADGFGQAAGDDGGARVLAQPGAYDDAAGNRNNILDRAADLDADRIVGEIDPEAWRPQQRGGLLRQPSLRAADGNRRRQSLRHLAGECRAAQHGLRMAGQGFGDRFGQQASARPVDAFGADDDRRTVRQGGQLRRRDAEILGRRYQQGQFRASYRFGKIAGCDDRFVDRMVGQEQGVAAVAPDRFDHFRLARPQADRAAAARARYGECGAPGAGADDRDPAHDPGPSARAASPVASWAGPSSESSGQRGRGAKSNEEVRPSASRSAPAQAIMAALSVQ